jgi:DNA-binding transcriptional regulator YiaG
MSLVFALHTRFNMTSIKPGSKYFHLYEHLRLSDRSSIKMTFLEIERILQCPLPDSARKSKAVWSNRSRGALQAMAWMKAGYHVEDVDIEGEQVTFRKPILRYEVHREEGTVLWDGVMVKALRAHLGVSQAELSHILGVRQQTVSEWETGIYQPTRSRSKHLTMVAEGAGFTFYGTGESEKGKLDT